MAKRKERNVSGQFIAVFEGQTLGPFTGRETAIKEVKAIMPEPTEFAADIYHRVCQVKVKNLETDNEKEQDGGVQAGSTMVSFIGTEPDAGVAERTAL